MPADSFERMFRNRTLGKILAAALVLGSVALVVMLCYVGHLKVTTAVSMSAATFLCYLGVRRMRWPLLRKVLYMGFSLIFAMESFEIFWLVLALAANPPWLVISGVLIALQVHPWFVAFSFLVLHILRRYEPYRIKNVLIFLLFNAVLWGWWFFGYGMADVMGVNVVVKSAYLLGTTLLLLPGNGLKQIRRLHLSFSCHQSV